MGPASPTPRPDPRLREGKQLLDHLPQDHPKRNRSLLELGAEYRLKTDKNDTPWHSLKRFHAARKTFNQLGPEWSDFAEFRA